MLLSTNEVCEILGVSRQTVVRLVGTGDLPCYMIGGKTRRFYREDVDAYIASVKVRPVRAPQLLAAPKADPPKRKRGRPRRGSEIQEYVPGMKVV